MRFGITQTVSFDVLNRLKSLNTVSDFLGKELSSKNYGVGLSSFLIGVNCYNPEMLTPPRDFETGFLLYKKYTKSKKLLECSIKLNYSEVYKATEGQLIDIITQALLKTYPEIVNLDIKNFEIGKFYNDLKNLLGERGWLHEPVKSSREAIPHLQKRERTVFTDAEKMPVGSFWELIEKARVDSHGNLYKQVEIITDRLSMRQENEIIGFECMLRDQLMRAFHYNVMAVQKIVEGSVSDDSFLYFRCKLILHGRMTFENAINNPNHISEQIDPKVSGEPLLTVSDKAFEMRFGTDTEKVLPRDYASEVIDYDFGEHEIQGKDWNEEDIPKRFSKLWMAYLK